VVISAEKSEAGEGGGPTVDPKRALIGVAPFLASLPNTLLRDGTTIE
jgi:hypothetical protein